MPNDVGTRTIWSHTPRGKHQIEENYERSGNIRESENG
jgi:hypothetical protein